NRRRKQSLVSTPSTKQNDRRQIRDRTVALVNLVMGQVKILNRGEKLSLEINDRGLVLKVMDLDLDLDKRDLVLGSTNRFGPKPVVMQKRIRISKSNLKDIIYAGSAFFTSPPPSFVLIPFFFLQKRR
ncbi:hypothetical protein RYX36_035805, partial [Vicia faba]